MKIIYNKNNKGHGGPIIPDWLAYGFMAFSYFVLFGICLSVSQAIKTFLYAELSVTKSAFFLSSIVITITILYLIIKNWHWKHYGFYNWKKENIFNSPNDDFEVRMNGEIYYKGKPFITKGKYYGWIAHNLEQ